jgi:hypothetical protein
MSEPTLFKIRLLKNMAFNSEGEILSIKTTDSKNNLYYYDGCHRWCYQSGDKEGIDWERVEKDSEDISFSITVTMKFDEYMKANELDEYKGKDRKEKLKNFVKSNFENDGGQGALELMGYADEIKLSSVKMVE